MREIHRNRKMFRREIKLHAHFITVIHNVIPTHPSFNVRRADYFRDNETTRRELECVFGADINSCPTNYRQKNLFKKWTSLVLKAFTFANSQELSCKAINCNRKSLERRKNQEDWRLCSPNSQALLNIWTFLFVRKWKGLDKVLNPINLWPCLAYKLVNFLLLIDLFCNFTDLFFDWKIFNFIKTFGLGLSIPPQIMH